MQKQCQGYDELVAKNFLLQDKVERQENFLKKRLNDDSRQRKLPYGKTPSPAPIRPSMGSRQREPSPARHSMGGQRAPPIPRTVNSKPKRRPVSVAKPTSKQDELGLLLDEV